MEKIVVLPDVHLTQSGYEKPYELVRDFIPQYKPHEIILLGDFMNCTSVSHWIRDKHRKLEGKRFKMECEFANRELDFLSKHCKKITYIEGNHENWVEQYLDANPNMEGLLELTENLELEKRNIKWIALNKLYRKGKLYFTHGTYITKYHSAKTLASYGCSIVYGHTHQAQTYMMNMQMQKSIMSYGLGCLCDHSPDYMRNKHANWINQFAIALIDEKTGKFNIYPINITDEQFRWEGKQYG